MAEETASDIFASQMGIGSDEAQRLLNRFAEGMTAELLEHKRLTVAGLGFFSAVHEQATREKTGSGTRYRPPKNRVAFEARKNRAGDTERIATLRLGMETGEAQRFVKALGEMFKRVKTGSGRLELRGFGSFTLVSSAFRFQPEASLEALFNIGYDELKEIIIAEHQKAKQTQPVPEALGGLKKVVLIVAFISMLLSGWFLYRQYAPDGFGPPSDSDVAKTSVPASIESSPSPVNAVAPEQAPLASATSHNGPLLPDSLILQKGRYTVIVATFSSKKGAHQEWRRLAGLGHQVWFWPVRSGGKRYYRLVTGDFATARAARDSMRSMPKGLSPHSYIQQAPKNVMLYGEPGL